MEKWKQDRMLALANAIERGNFDRNTKEEFRQLFTEAVTERLRPQMPAIAAEARRRVAIQRAAEAGRRAGMAAGRQFASDAHQRAHDAVIRNRSRRR